MKRILFILLALFLTSNIAFASAKIIVPIKKEVRINADSGFETADYTWVLVAKDGEILDTQNSPVYTQKFSKEGNYDLNLTVADKKTGEMKSTSAKLIIGKSSKFFEGIDIKVDTIPTIDSDGEIAFSGGSGSVSFFFADSKGIKEFHLDKNILIDTNKDNNPSNDVDNKDHVSFKDGSTFTIQYEGTGSLTARVNFVGFNDVVETRDFKIVFNKKIQKQYSGKLQAVLKTLPKYDEQNKEIYVPYGINEVYLYAKESVGDFIQYRIDEDISIDTDGDGKPDNDIDNKSMPSLSDGNIYSIKRSDKDYQVSQLLIVSGNRGSAIRRKIVWGKENQNKIMAIYSSSDQVLVDSDVIFGISGLDESSEYNIEWDLDGDGKTDKKNKQYAKYSYDDAGLYNVSAKIYGTGDLITELKTTIEVRNEAENEIKTKKPIPDFEYKINGPYVTFIQNTVIDSKILNKGYSSFWKFGDGNISTEQNPEFIYASVGNFVVELTVTDSHSKMASIKKEIEITDLALKTWPDENIVNTGSISSSDKKDDGIKKDDNKVVDTKKDLEDKKPQIKDTKQSSGNSTFVSILIYLGIFIGVVGFILFIYILYLKIKNPDYSFGEIIEEEREKILSFIEGEPYVPLAGEISSEVHGGVSAVLANKAEEKDTAKEVQVAKDESSKNNDSVENVSPVTDTKHHDESGDNNTSESYIDNSINNTSANDIFKEDDDEKDAQSEQVGGDSDLYSDGNDKNNDKDSLLNDDFNLDDGNDFLDLDDDEEKNSNSQNGGISEDSGYSQAQNNSNSISPSNSFNNMPSDNNQFVPPPPPPPPPAYTTTPAPSIYQEAPVKDEQSQNYTAPSSNTSDNTNNSSAANNLDIPDWLK